MAWSLCVKTVKLFSAMIPCFPGLCSMAWSQLSVIAWEIPCLDSVSKGMNKAIKEAWRGKFLIYGTGAHFIFEFPHTMDFQIIILPFINNIQFHCRNKEIDSLSFPLLASLFPNKSIIVYLYLALGGISISFLSLPLVRERVSTLWFTTSYWISSFNCPLFIFALFICF